MREQLGQTDAVETLQFLAGSGVRIRLLAELRERRADARTLVDSLDVPHSTVQRNLNKLEERGWIGATLDRSYYTTSVGEIVLDALEGTPESLESVDGMAAFVECAPVDSFGFDPERLAGAEYVVADEETPSAPLNAFVRRLDEADGFALATPNWNPAYREVVERQLDSPAGEAEVVTERTQRSLLTGDGIGTLADLQDDDRLTVRLCDERLSVGLGLVDGGVAVAGYRDGTFRVLAITDDEAVRSWARRRLEALREESTALRQQVA